MTARRERFEVVHSNSGWHARLRAANGAIVAWSEDYKRKRGAERAVELMAGARIVQFPNRATVGRLGSGLLAEVRYIDTRTQP